MHNHEYHLDESAQAPLKALLKHIKRAEESEFPNARGVRNLFEETLRYQSERLFKQNIRAKAKLSKILPEDLPLPKDLKIKGNTAEDGNIITLPRK